MKKRSIRQKIISYLKSHERVSTEAISKRISAHVQSVRSTIHGLYKEGMIKKESGIVRHSKRRVLYSMNEFRTTMFCRECGREVSRVTHDSRYPCLNAFRWICYECDDKIKQKGTQHEE